MFDEITSSTNKVDSSDRFAGIEEAEEAKVTQPTNQKIQTFDSKPTRMTRTSYEDITISKLEEEILNVLAGKEKIYGLQIIEAFEESSNGKRNIGVGSLYPTLSRLEEKGLVTSWMENRPTDEKGGARRKYFRITQLGLMVMTEAEKFRRKLYEWQPAI